MNPSEIVLVVVGIAVTLERILEFAWSWIEPRSSKLKELKQNQDFDYGAYKTRISIPVGMLAGGFLLGFSNVLGIDFGLTAVNPQTRALLGLVAGALAPYSHQIVELLYQGQKLVQVKKENILAGSEIQQHVVEQTSGGLQRVEETVTTVKPAQETERTTLATQG